MDQPHRPTLEERVTQAAEAALEEQKYASPLDVVLGIGWLPWSTAQSWRQGRVDCLEGVLQVKPARLLDAMRLLRSWATAKGLVPSEADYIARTPERQRLRFSVSGDPAVEQQYRTHWLSPALSDKQRERMVKSASRAPDLVVIETNKDWTCHRCGGTGGLLIMENGGPACLKCAGLDDLEFLARGDAALTRRAKAKSAKFAVVVRFSRARRRYERQGVLVEPAALLEAEREIAAERR
jgi:hypothetical protein